MTPITKEVMQQFFEKDADTISTWFEATVRAYPQIGYEGLKDNPGFLCIAFSALESWLEAGKTIADWEQATKPTK